MSYDYKDGKLRVLNILKNKIKVEETDSIPETLSEFTYDNAKLTWISAIFVDLRNSTKFLEEGDKEKVTKLLRAYASEIISIMNESKHVREIGVRGDGVYAIFSTNTKNKIKEVLDLSYWINTYMSMLNALLVSEGFDSVKAGTGVATSYDLIAKVGRKGTGVNDRVWIGKCVSTADRLSKITNKGTLPIGINNITYSNSNDVDNTVAAHFKYDTTNECYFGNVIKSEFSDWIKSGMKV
jgi:class 3 adenylate cyclase